MSIKIYIAASVCNDVVLHAVHTIRLHNLIFFSPQICLLPPCASTKNIIYCRATSTIYLWYHYIYTCVCPKRWTRRQATHTHDSSARDNNNIIIIIFSSRMRRDKDTFFVLTSRFSHPGHTAIVDDDDDRVRVCDKIISRPKRNVLG